jgi:hypothetical protein
MVICRETMGLYLTDRQVVVSVETAAVLVDPVVILEADREAVLVVDPVVILEVLVASQAIQLLLGQIQIAIVQNLVIPLLLLQVARPLQLIQMELQEKIAKAVV